MLLSLTAASSNLLKYRAIYEFVARNSDELSFQPGDVIMVSFIYSSFCIKRCTEVEIYIFVHAFFNSRNILYTGYSKHWYLYFSCVNQILNKNYKECSCSIALLLLSWTFLGIFIWTFLAFSAQRGDGIHLWAATLKYTIIKITYIFLVFALYYMYAFSTSYAGVGSCTPICLVHILWFYVLYIITCWLSLIETLRRMSQKLVEILYFTSRLTLFKISGHQHFKLCN